MNKFFLYILLFLSAVQGYGQNARTDMGKLNASYARHKDLSMGITYHVYANHRDADPIETSAGSYFQRGSDRYNRLNEIESVQNNECSIVIDNEEKFIAIGNPVKYTAGKIATTEMDTVLDHYASVTYIDNQGVQKGYSFKIKPKVPSEYERIDVFFNSKTWMVERMVYYYRDKQQLIKTNQDAAEEKPRLEVIFSNIKFEAGSDSKFYSESRFVHKKDGKYFPAGAYAGYKIINQKIAQ
jgi:hypothetical protein